MASLYWRPRSAVPMPGTMTSGDQARDHHHDSGMKIFGKAAISGVRWAALEVLGGQRALHLGEVGRPVAEGQARSRGRGRWSASWRPAGCRAPMPVPPQAVVKFGAVGRVERVRQAAPAADLASGRRR